MAFQPHRIGVLRDDLEDHSSVSLAGIIKLQPSRRKANKSWRPMQASDLRESPSTSGDGSFHFAGGKSSHDVISKLDSQHPIIGFQSRLSTLSNVKSVGDEMDGIYDVPDTIEGTELFERATDSSSGHEDAAEAIRLRLFGNLPDPVRLSEQLGQFDGQVVFISHPNRDISAHQWSSSSFQWVNIGRYSSSLGKVEGSLASDRPRGIDETRDTIEYFKLAAENRQALIIECGRSEDQAAMERPVLHASVDMVERPQMFEELSDQGFLINDHTRNEAGSSFLSTAHTRHAKDVLEDPFVASGSVSLIHSMRGNGFRDSAAHSTGALDFAYKFPTQTSVDASSVTESGAFSIKSVGNALGLPSAPRLQEIACGEEAATRHVSLLTQDELHRHLPSSTAYPIFRDHSEILNKVEDALLSLPWSKDVNSDSTMSDPATRFTAPARSVLLTKYTPSNLNATAAPYTQAPRGHDVLQRSDSSASTAKAGSVALHYSDPDGLRKSQQYEVANGLTQQAPTVQSFKGPFFTDSKPTAHDPTASLSVRVSEEEKLINWFRDGHRPARQREYTRSLIATAAASDKNRYFGAIGQARSKLEDGPYSNTGPFVRLYENLSEYVEEHRNGSGQSYFTRRWKAASPQLREGGGEYSRSYFRKGGGRPSWPGAALLRPSDRLWG